MIDIRINALENDMPLGEVLRGRQISRRLVTKLKRTENGITRDGRLVRTIDKVYAGEVISLADTEGEPLDANGSLDVGVLYEDNDVVVFDKPAFMPCHPSINHQGDTLGNYFAYYCPMLTFRPVNRLDRDTSGCVIVAKNQHSAHALQKSYDKKYYGLTKEIPLAGGRICAPIAREKESIILRCVRADGQYSVTNWLRLKSGNGYSLLEFELETGRTHQIRVHMAHIGYAIVGDSMYGGDCSLLNGQALHCGEVKFVSPTSGKVITVKSKPPFLELIK